MRRETALGMTRSDLRRRVSAWAALSRFTRRKPLGAAGGFLVLLVVFAALFAPFISPHDPIFIYRGKQFTPPGAEFLLGTDNVGRDLLSRLIWGSRVSLYVGAFSVLIGSSIGAMLGVTSAYFGRTFDTVVQRVIDSIMAFPALVLAIAIVAMMGASTNNVMAALSVVLIPQGTRVIRSTALSAKENQYIEAARAIGCSDLRIILRHLLPQCVAPFIVLATASVGWAIVIEASLNFLGVGTPPPTPTWGGMLSGAARRYAESAPWMAIFPGIAISFAVFGFNMLGDALRDVLDPRLRTG
ncbi:MAG: ABC transporter permease [Chloroflexi bacterium]|nr:ABC transporter permease [Chloroflexota bacterium]